MEPENAKNHLTARDICNIIKSCKESGLKQLVYQDLHLEFQQPTAEIVDLQSEQPNLQAIGHQMPLIINNADNLDSPDALEEPDELEDMHLAVSDPVAWEKKHLEGNDYAAQVEQHEA